MNTFSLEHPVLAVDVVIFRIHKGSLETLLMQRSEDPFRGAPALPGVAVRVDETLEQAAKRTLYEKVCWPKDDQNQPYLEQLATFDALYRDPRGRTVSVAYIGIAGHAAPELHDLLWEPAAQIAQGNLPFDHALIIKTAVQRLQGKLRYTNIARAFVDETFRIEELHDVYQAILARPVNLTNLRVKLLKINLIEQVSILNDAVGKKGGRPPHIYRFVHECVKTVEREFV